MNNSRYPMLDVWDSDAGRTHSVGDGCVPAHQVSGDSLPPALTELANVDGANQDARAHALHIHGKLSEQLETLRLLEYKRGALVEERGTGAYFDHRQIRRMHITAAGRALYVSESARGSELYPDVETLEPASRSALSRR
jgi:hypothetical protein